MKQSSLLAVRGVSTRSQLAPRQTGARSGRWLAAAASRCGVVWLRRGAYLALALGAAPACTWMADEFHARAIEGSSEQSSGEASAGEEPSPAGSEAPAVGGERPPPARPPPPQCSQPDCVGSEGSSSGDSLDEPGTSGEGPAAGPGGCSSPGVASEACGASCPSPCLEGEPCQQDEDCELPLLCSAAGLCAAGLCEEGVRSHLEPRDGCGESGCGPCAAGRSCSSGEQCESGVCDSTCQTPTCSDGVHNGAEADTDCGGSESSCEPCPDQSRCRVDADCQSGHCSEGACISCFDGITNGFESDVDCGGESEGCGLCAPGAQCRADADCQSGACQDGLCCGGSNGDCTRCAVRLSTTRCDSGNCASFLQCLRDNADVCPQRFSSGCAGLGDACDHTRFGGENGREVQQANQVLVNAGCSLF